MDRRTTTIDIAHGLRLCAWRADDGCTLLRHADDEQVSRATSDRFPFPDTRADGEAFPPGCVVDFEAPVFRDRHRRRSLRQHRLAPGAGRATPRRGARLLAGTPVLGQEGMGRAVGMFAPWVTVALVRPQATVLDFDIGSARVLPKNGFVEEGVQRNAVVKRGKLHDLRMFARVRNHVDDAP